MQKRLRCWLLCEDVEQERLFRPIVERHFYRVYVERPKSHGGASFVLQNLKRLAQYIRRYNQETVALLAVIDGDSTGLLGRLKEVRAAAGFSGETWEKRIAVCVPCRNVETWEMWLCGAREINEQTGYKEVFHREVERGTMSARKAVDGWFSLLKEEDRLAEEARLPALAHGRKEVARLQGFAKR